MKTIKCNEKLQDSKGEVLKDKDGIEFTIGIVLTQVLSGRVSNPNLGWVLGKKFAREDSVDLKAEEIVFIKKEVENNAQQDGGYPAVISGQILEILDSK